MAIGFVILMLAISGLLVYTAFYTRSVFDAMETMSWWLLLRSPVVPNPAVQRALLAIGLLIPTALGWAWIATNWAKIVSVGESLRRFKALNDEVAQERKDG